MLVMSRLIGEAFVVGGDCKITYISRQEREVWVAIEGCSRVLYAQDRAEVENEAEEWDFQSFGSDVIVVSLVKGEGIYLDLGDDVYFALTDLRSTDKARFGFAAPRDITIHRWEIAQELRRQAEQ